MENTYSAAGLRILRSDNGLWFVEEDHTKRVLHVGVGDYFEAYNDCVICIQWYREGTES